MKRNFIFSLLVSSLLFITGTFSFAQSEQDAYNLSQRTLSGTARFRSMAGAFVALGGDASAVERNPAVAGTFHSSDLSFTFDGKLSNNSSIWGNTNESASRFSTSASQISATYSYFNRSSGNGLSLVLNVSQPYNINRRIIATQNTPSDYSLADFTAYSTLDNLSTKDLTSATGYDPYGAGISWLSILGYNAGWIVPVSGDKGPYDTVFQYPNNDDKYVAYGPEARGITLEEKGAVTETDIAFGYNWQDRLYVGASLKVSNIHYQLNSIYKEHFVEGNYLILGNQLSTSGTGVTGSIGVIGRPTDHLRLGIAVHTPSLYMLTDVYNAEAASLYSFGLDSEGNLLPESQWRYSASTPNDAYSSYRLLAPTRVAMGVAYTIGSRGVISFDYEFMPFSGMKFYNTRGDSRAFNVENNSIREHYGIQHTLRLGGEFRATKSLALRAGYMLRTSPTKNLPGLNGDVDKYSETTVLTAGTIPHYIIPSSEHTATCGIGYAFSILYVDLAYQMQTRKNYLYAFPTIRDNATDKVLVHAGTPATISSMKHHFVMTLGFRI